MADGENGVTLSFDVEKKVKELRAEIQTMFEKLPARSDAAFKAVKDVEVLVGTCKTIRKEMQFYSGAGRLPAADEAID